MSGISVVGIDLSLTGTGVATINAAGVNIHLVQTTGRAGDGLATRSARLLEIRDEITAIVDRADPDLVVIEGPSYGQARASTAGRHDRSGLWWMVVMDRVLAGIPAVEVPPAVRARYATGKGNAAKDSVLAAVVRRYAEVPVVDNNTADALVLAAMGARRLGAPIEVSLPQAHLAAMASVSWPNTAEGVRHAAAS